jgi:hypothetical protein
MNIVLICMIPVCIIATGFLVLKSVQLGLKWQIQTAEKQEPELKVLQPIVEAVKENKAAELNKQREQFMKEYSPFQ